MRTIQKPAHDPKHVFHKCIESISRSDNGNLRGRLEAVAMALLAEGADYDRMAAARQLYTIPADERKNDEIVRGTVTKSELKSVYTSHMVTKSKPARDIYELLLASSPGGLCPLCGFGHAETLDHYLSKAKFPQFSVLPYNLVPACKSCNHSKLDTVATDEGKQPIHPYYDHGHYVTDRWLYAEVRESAPPTIRYYVSPPVHWDQVSMNRVASHFSDFKLAKRFSVQAVDELAMIRGLLGFCKTEASRRERLFEHAQVAERIHPNCWKTAFYHALANSDWYCRTGYLIG